MDTRRFRAKQIGEFFVLYVPLICAAFLSFEHIDLPTDIKSDIFGAVVFFISVTCVFLVCFQNLKTLVRQLLWAALGALLMFLVFHLI